MEGGREGEGAIPRSAGAGRAASRCPRICARPADFRRWHRLEEGGGGGGGGRGGGRVIDVYLFASALVGRLGLWPTETALERQQRVGDRF